MKQFIVIILFVPFLALSQTNFRSINSKKDNSSKASDSLKKDNKYQNSQSFVFDFKTKSVTNPKELYTVRSKDFIQIKIINYNPFLYKVEMEGYDSTVSPQIDTKLPFASFDLTNLNDIVKNILDINSSMASNESSTPNNAEEKEKMMIGETNDVKGNKKKSISRFLNETLIDVYKINDSLNQLNESIEKQAYKNSKKLDFAYDIFPNANSFSSIPSIQNDIESVFLDIRSRILQRKQDILKSYNYFIKESFGYSEKIKKSPVYSELDSLIKIHYSGATDLINKMDSSYNYSELRKFIDTLNKFKFLETTYLSFPILIKDDIKTINLKISPWQSDLKLPSYESSISLPIKQSSIWGLSLGAYTAGLYNDGYSNKKISDSLYQLVSDNQSKGAEIGINANAYFSRRLSYSSNVFLGAVVGTGMSIEGKPKPRLLFGPNLVFGEKNRFNISLGVIAGFVQKLSDSYSLNASYKVPIENFTKDYLKCSWYLSMHLSLLNR